MGTFGSRLREFRKHKRESQEDFAAKFGGTQANMTQWELDRNKPSDIIRDIEKAYPDLNMDWLETGKGSMISMLISSTMSSVPDNNPIPIPKIEYIDLVHSKEILSIKLDSANQKIDALSQVVDSKQKEIETLKILIENLK